MLEDTSLTQKFYDTEGAHKCTHISKSIIDCNNVNSRISMMTSSFVILAGNDECDTAYKIMECVTKHEIWFKVDY